MKRGLGAVLLGAAALSGCDDTVFQNDVVSYEADWLGVQMFLVDHCVECHQSASSGIVLPDDLEEDLDLEAGTYIVPGDPAASMLWRVVSGEVQPGDPLVMPIGTGPLPTYQIEHLEAWILAGAPR